MTIQLRIWHPLVNLCIIWVPIMKIFLWKCVCSLWREMHDNGIDLFLLLVFFRWKSFMQYFIFSIRAYFHLRLFYNIVVIILNLKYILVIYIMIILAMKLMRKYSMITMLKINLTVSKMLLIVIINMTHNSLFQVLVKINFFMQNTCICILKR